MQTVVLLMKKGKNSPLLFYTRLHENHFEQRLDLFIIQLICRIRETCCSVKYSFSFQNLIWIFKRFIFSFKDWFIPSIKIQLYQDFHLIFCERRPTISFDDQHLIHQLINESVNCIRLLWCIKFGSRSYTEATIGCFFPLNVKTGCVRAAFYCIAIMY